MNVASLEFFLFIIAMIYPSFQDYRFTKIECEGFDDSIGFFEYCRLKAVNRHTNYIGVRARLLKPLKGNITFRYQLMQRLNGWKPFLYDITLDICKFLQHHNNPVIGLFYDSIKSHTNLKKNFRCPFAGTIIIDNLTNAEGVDFSKKLPMPSGDYGEFTSWSSHSLDKYKIRENTKRIKSGEVLIKSVGLQDQLGSNFDYNGLLAKYRDEFKKRWKSLQPSPHMGDVAYEFETFPLLGVGKFGTVHLLQQGENCIALKVLRKAKVITDKVVEKTIIERQVLAAVQFPFLISLVAAYKDNDYLYIGLPFIGGGDLFDYHRRRHRFSEHVARFYGSQVLLALEYLHNIKCLYRDLKLENILLDITGYVKLTDFGLAKFVEDRTTTLCGTPEYLAPEMLGMKPYGTSVDWWSFGVLMFELVAGQTPFVRYSHNLVEMYSKICEGAYDMPPNFSDNFQQLVTGLLVVQQAIRLGSLCNGAVDIKNHVFFRSVNWQALINQTITPPYIPRLASPCDTSFFRKPLPKSTGKSYNRIVRSNQDQYTEFFKSF